MSAPIYGSLGIGRLLGETYALFFRRILTFLTPVVLIVLAAVVASLILGRLFGGGFISQVILGSTNIGDLLLFGAVGLVIVLLYLAIMGMVALITMELNRSRKPALFAIFGQALRATPMLVVLGIVAITLLLVGIFVVNLIAQVFSNPDLAGFLIFITVFGGGLFLYVKLAPILPLIVYERAGLSAFRRSFELTKGYFWPILGLLLINIFIVMVVSGVIAALVGFVSFGIIGAGTDTSLLVFQIMRIGSQSLLAIFSYLIPVVLSTLIYLRLRALKEGGDTEDIAQVFE